MATWDGSDQTGPSTSNSNVYRYASTRSVTADPRDWSYYSHPGPITYTNNSVNSYTHNNLPGINAVNYQKPLYPNTTAANATFANDRSSFYEKNRTSNKLPSFNFRNSGIKQDTTVTQPSSLHADASEFVPTGAMKNIQRNSSAGSYNNTDVQYNDYTSENAQRPSHTYFSDNRNRIDRRYDTKNSNNYRGAYKGQRSRNNEQSYNGSRDNDTSTMSLEAPSVNSQQSEDNTYRSNSNAPRPRNHGRYQNDRYPNNRQQHHYENSRPGRRKQTTDVWQNPPDTSRDNSTISDDTRETGGNSYSNNRGKWPRNDRKYGNERHAGNRQQNGKTSFNDYEEQKGFDNLVNPLVGSKMEGQNHDGERSYRNDRVRVKRGNGTQNFNDSGGNYYEYDGQEKHERDNVYERGREDYKKPREQGKMMMKGGMKKNKKIEFGKFLDNFFYLFVTFEIRLLKF